jgi:GNAT superfamily N-acetyltransferase
MCCVIAEGNVIVRELSAFERGALERHFVALEAEDRRLRFGIALGDYALRAYVQRIDFARDAVFGVLDDELELLGVAHLARDAASAELGVSVRAGARGRGIGGALLARAHTHARNWGVRTLFMHCLRENGAMMHLARKQGMELASEAGEVDAHLVLPPPDAATHFGEVFAQRLALFDHAFKTQLLQARRIASALATPVTASPTREK